MTPTYRNEMSWVGRLEDYQFLVGTTHFDGEDNLLYVTKEVYVGQSPEG